MRTSTSTIFRRSAFVILVLLIPAVLLSGCFISRELTGVRNDIEQAYPGTEFSRGLVLNFRPATIRVASWLNRKVAPDELAVYSDYADDVDHVRVGLFETKSLATDEPLHLPRLPQFRSDGWQVAASVREADEMVWLLVRETEGNVRDLFVLVLDQDDLIMVRVEGYLNSLVQRLMANHAFAAR